jgi:hypothetical protein
MLTIFEEFLMLTIHAEKGMLIGSAIEPMRPGLVGAILAELAFAGKIRTTSDRRLELVDSNQTNIIVLDAAINILKTSEKNRKYGYWINTINQKPEKLRKQITKGLILKKIFTQEDDSLHWVIPSPIHSVTNASSKYWLIKRLRGVVLAQEKVEPRDIALLSLLSASGLLELVFLRDECKQAARNINELVISQAMKDPMIETIQEISVAVVDMVEEDE